jgi:Flp pilus assembly protein TadG
MIHPWAMRFLKRFAGNERGNFAIIGALCAIPLVGVAGLALDYSRIASTKERLQASVDAAIIAAAASGGGVNDMQLLAADMVEANFTEGDVKVETVVDTYRMRLEARYFLDLPVMAVVGKPETEIVVTAEVTSETPLRGGAIDAPAANKDLQKQIKSARRQFSQSLRQLPRHMRDEYEAQFDAAIRQLEQQAAGAGNGDFHLSK